MYLLLQFCPMADQLVEAILAEMRRRLAHPSLLCWLLHREAFPRLDLTRALLEVVAAAGGCEKDLKSAEFLASLAGALGRRAVALTEVSSDFVVAWTKKDAIEKAVGKGWQGPSQPFVVQTVNNEAKGSPAAGKLFYVFQCPVFGLRYLRDLLHRGACVVDGREVAVTQCWEHQWVFPPPGGDPGECPAPARQRLAQMLLDWELETSLFTGEAHAGVTQEALEALALRFPSWFHQQLLTLGVVDHAQTLEIVVKRRSRPGKVSYHFLVRLAGTPSDTHRRICEMVFQPHEGTLRRLRLLKANDPGVALTREELDFPGLGMDLGTTKGGQGFSTMFSVKKAGNPPPTLLCVLRFRGRGEGERREYPPCFSEQVQAVGHPEALWMLHEASYTVGSMGCIAPTLVFLDRLVSPLLFGPAPELNRGVTRL